MSEKLTVESDKRPSDVQMVRSLVAEKLALRYRNHRLRPLILRAILRQEGGQMRSMTLRDVLSQHHDVTVGSYSYGSLLEPGRADRRTTIGSYVSIGPDVRRFGAAHPLSAPSMHPYWYNPALGFAARSADVVRTGIVIGHDVWIGAGTLLLPGCTQIGNGAVIGAGSVVTKDVGAYEIWAGNPAKRIGERLSNSLRDELDASRWWELDPKKAALLLAAIGGTPDHASHVP